jgi:intracellular multiplication protein IcmK
MKKTIILFLLILIGHVPWALAADNITPAELQQLQALQQTSPQPPVRQLQLAPQVNQNTLNQPNTPPSSAPSPSTALPNPSTPAPAPASGIPIPSTTPTNLPPTVPATSTPVTSANAAGQAFVGALPNPINQTAVTLPGNSQLPQPNALLPANQLGAPPTSFGQQTVTAVQGGSQMPPLQAPFVPPGSPTGDTDVNQAAFNAMTNTALPMTPDQIHRLKQLFTATQYAQAAPPGTPPRPVATSQMVNLAPGATPPVIRLAQGFVTSLVFIDSTGAPWPIDSYSVGDPSRFNIQWNKTDNTLMIQAMSLYNYGNLAVRLKGLVTPVMLTLIPGQKDIDYRVDLRVQGLGPNALPLIGETLPNAANPLLLGVLDGIPPPGSRELNVCDTDIQAWLLGNRLFIRSHFVILSPAWLATLSSADGTKAYEMQKTPMLLVSLHGKAVPVKIEGF